MKDEMLRYNNGTSSRKDLLYTFRADNLIFFGISRTNLQAGDKFNKELAKEIAQARAMKARAEYDETKSVVFADFTVRSINHGVVTVDRVKELLGYFDALTARSFNLPPEKKNLVHW